MELISEWDTSVLAGKTISAKIHNEETHVNCSWKGNKMRVCLCVVDEMEESVLKFNIYTKF